MNYLRNWVCSIVLFFFAAGLVQASEPNRTGLWWNKQESGWGLFLVDQGSAMFPAWYTYDQNGKAIWSIGALEPQTDGSHQGTLHRYTGVPFDQISGQAADPAQPFVTATLTFPSTNTLEFTYVKDGVTQTKQLETFGINGSQVQCRFSEQTDASNLTDLWFDPASSGWGVNLVHVDDTVAIAWYTYGADRQPNWYIGALNKQTDGAFTGEVSRGTQGTPYMDIDGKPILNNTEKAGTIMLSTRDDGKLSMAYTIGDVQQEKLIQRLIAGKPQTCTGQPKPTNTFAGKANHVLLETSLGRITIELFPNESPKTVENFKQYVRDGFYDQTIIHRVAKDFVIEGGGYTTNYVQKPTRAPILNEAQNRLSNLRGTVAMARSSDIHSATSQFFINLKDNTFLNHRSPFVPGRFGYAVFGKVVDGMDVVDVMSKVPTRFQNPMGQNVPVTNIVITKVTLLDEAETQ